MTLAAVVTAVPASASIVINGCTIVDNPTPTSHTRCPGANLASANLVGVNLSYAELRGANFRDAMISACTVVQNPPPFPPSGSCTGANFTAADLKGAEFAGSNLGEANLSNAHLDRAELASALFNECVVIYDTYTFCDSPDLSGASIRRADLSGAVLGSSNFDGADLTGANLAGVQFGRQVDYGPTSLAGANLSHANLTGTNTQMADLTGAGLDRTLLTGTPLVPSNQTAPATSAKGSVVTWATPPGQPGATPGSCNHPSGSFFRIGTTTVRCTVADNAGDQGLGFFTVMVS